MQERERCNLPQGKRRAAGKGVSAARHGCSKVEGRRSWCLAWVDWLVYLLTGWWH